MLTITILNHKTCQIATEDLSFLKSLKYKLSFKIVGAKYQQYRNNWDGTIHLLSKSNQFSIGLLNEVKQFCKNKDIEYEIKDNRTYTITDNPNSLNITNKLKELNIEPRDYQLQALEKVKDYKYGILKMATGSGKTLVSCLIAAYFNQNINIYVIGLNLLQQFYDLFCKIFGEDLVGYVGNGICKISKFNIISIFTAGRALNIDKKELTRLEEDDIEETFEETDKEKIINCIKSSKIFLLDESQSCKTTTVGKILKHSPNVEIILGMSGTPYSDLDEDLLATKSVLGEKIIDITASYLIKQNVLVKPYIYFISVPKQKAIGETYQEIYSEYVVNNKDRNALIVQNAKKLLKSGYAPLVLFRVIKHGDILAELFEQENIRYGLLSGKDELEQRLEVINQFNNKEIDIILSSSIFQTGVDIPSLSALINCSGGKSYTVNIQKVGRVIRSFPNKKKAIIIDFADQCKYLKDHSKKRLSIFQDEPEFEITIPGIMVKK